MPLVESEKNIEPRSPIESGLLGPVIQVGKNVPTAFDFDKILGFYLPITVNVVDTDAATAAKYGTFFIADFPCQIIEAVERHKTAGTDASAVTLQVEKLTSGTAPGSGLAVLNTTFSLKSTANTPVRIIAKVNSANIVLKPKDTLALLTTGVLTAVNFVTVTVYIRPLYTKLQNI